MTKYIRQVAFVAAMAVGVSSILHAEETEDRCSSTTLKGLYVFNTAGFNVVAGVAQPAAILELIRFNGDGSLSVPAATVSMNGTIIRPAGGVGTYSVAADCTGKIVFGPPGPTFDFVLAPGGSTLYMIRTGPGSPVVQGQAHRLSN
ncbi:MAG: hypothetical protein M3O26_04960 [Pseudomonadota bacterium]|nr:hypothetical protein [Pseudomonadota bacterium]